jgi:general secretion pathway protein D
MTKQITVLTLAVLVGTCLAQAGTPLQTAAEESALNQVTAAWNGMILRDYSLSEKAVENMGLADKEQSADVRNQFPDVPFPEGAKAIYRPALERLVVLNTLENLQKLETVMTALEKPLSSDSDQIEITARFVEFSEGALEELGFNWADTLDGQAQALADEWSIGDGESLFADALRDSSSVFQQPGMLGAGEKRVAGDWTAARLSDHFDTTAGTLRLTGDIGSEIELLIRALDQTAGADVLSAPRVVTQAGKEAVIQVGQRHYFPDEFEVTGNEGNIIHVNYEGFEEALMGVELKVEPRLTENSLIELELNPVITELLGWRYYEVAPADSSYTYYQYRIGMTFEHDAIRARLPIFRQRKIETNVTIKDGSTIGMGGLIHEKTESFSDRVPVLGSIPLVGRLFRSEGERSVKRNLMIFVTAGRVDPNGRKTVQYAAE